MHIFWLNRDFCVIYGKKMKYVAIGDPYNQKEII